jgi:hypothetical protein
MTVRSQRPLHVQKLPVIPVNRVVDAKRIIGKNGGPGRRRDTKGLVLGDFFRKKIIWSPCSGTGLETTLVRCCRKKGVLCQAAEMAFFQSVDVHQGLPDGILLNQNPTLGKFWMVLQWKILVYFIAIWSILRSFGI